MWAYNKLTRIALLAVAMSHTHLVFADDMPAESKPVVEETLSTPQQARISDVVIGRDLTVLKTAQDRIAKLNNNGVEAENYYLVKAQAWLDFAMHEYYENDRTQVIENALAEAYVLITQMEAASNQISMDTKVIPESVRLREDLWKIAAELKAHQGFACAAAPIAEMEVRLVWAGHEHQELGWRHAREHFAAAERLAKRAKKLVDNCFCPKPEDKPCPMIAVAPVEPEPTTAPVTQKTQMRLVNVPRNVHFGLDKSNLNTKAVLVLDKVIMILKEYPNIDIRLVGHTDSRASQAYNLALSERRAKSVLKYLQQQGIGPNRMGMRGDGFNELKTAEDELIAHALSRRVEIEYFGEKIESYDQTGDVVVEEMLKAKAAKANKKTKTVSKKRKK